MADYTQKEINHMLLKHYIFIKNMIGGERLKLCNKDLGGLDFSESILKFAEFENCIFEGASFSQSNLNNACFTKCTMNNVDFCAASMAYVDFESSIICDCEFKDAILFCAELSSADKIVSSTFANANLSCASIDKYTLKSGNCFIDANMNTASVKSCQISGIGSEQCTITYFPSMDKVICGCWNNDGGTLKEFREYVEEVYGDEGSEPNEQCYNEYMYAMKIFEAKKYFADLKNHGVIF